LEGKLRLYEQLDSATGTVLRAARALLNGHTQHRVNGDLAKNVIETHPMITPLLTELGMIVDVSGIGGDSIVVFYPNI